MKQILFFLITSFALSSCSNTSGSGNITTENRSVGGFTGISVGGDFDVEVKIGTSTELKVEADDNIMPYIETIVSGNTLKIITPSLVKVNASASARVDVQDVLKSIERLYFNASSSGDINADVDAPEVEANASSGATINLSGKTRAYNVQVSSGADIRSYNLLSETTKVQVSSGAGAHVYASVSLNAQASSGGTVSYMGGATVNKAESSGGSINKKD